VHLGNAVDIISRLYADDENERGRTIVEVIRKVRETNNRTDDILARNRQYLEAMRGGYESLTDSLWRDVESVRSNDAEAALSQGAAVIEANTVAVVAAIEEAEVRALESIAMPIADRDATDRELVRTAKSELEEENQTHLAPIARMGDARRQIEDGESAEKTRCRRESEERAEQLGRRHDAAVQRVRTRIEAATDLRAKAIGEHESKKRVVFEANEPDMLQGTDGTASIVRAFDAREAAIGDQIAGLCARREDLKHRLLAPAQGRGDVEGVRQMKDRREAGDERIEASFAAFHETVRAAHTSHCPVGQESAGGRRPAKNWTAVQSSMRVAPVDRARRRPLIQNVAATRVA